jgi:hypothetical protein
MPSTSWAQKVVPYGADQTVYFVIDRFGKFSSVHREAEVERTDLETVITDLMSGQFNDPIRVVWQCPLMEVKQTWRLRGPTSELDGVDGAQSAASKCRRVVAYFSKQICQQQTHAPQ